MRFANYNYSNVNCNFTFKIYELIMEIVARLKSYMEKEGLTISQFADAAGIPRPTLSQILNGRNKKISNEIIGKIHYAFPRLNIVWLLFGDGTPVTNENIEISDGKNRSLFETAQKNITDYEVDNGLFSIQNDKLKNYSDKSDPYDFEEMSENNDSNPSMDSSFSKISAANNTTYTENVKGLPISQGSTASQRKVISIMVFYSDNSFESFKPSESK